MKKTTTGLIVAALLVSGSMNRVLRADELIRRDDVVVADESRHGWLTERGGRTGQMRISGGLLSSPCTLETNELPLPMEERLSGYTLRLELNGCGEGEEIVSAGYRGKVVMRRVQLRGPGEKVFRWSPRRTEKQVVLYDGWNQLTYHLYRVRQRLLAGDPDKKGHNEAENQSVILRLCYE
ncbi:nuclease PIN [Salmonella enterica]|nr:nuclease PIN [Salmonella enterica]